MSPTQTRLTGFLSIPDPSGPLRSIPQPYEEGCLSLPDLRLEVLRPKGATISATGVDGASFEMTDDGLLARVWQHEYDHLEARLIFDACPAG